MSVGTIPLVDLWAMIAALVAAYSLAMRGEILKPEMKSYFSGPLVVRLSVTFTSIALGGRVISIWGGGSATAGEAAVYTVLAWSASVLLWNLQRQLRSDDQKVRGDRS